MERTDEVMSCGHEWCAPFAGYQLLDGVRHYCNVTSRLIEEKLYGEAYDTLRLARSLHEEVRTMIWPIDVIGQRRLQESADWLKTLSLE